MALSKITQEGTKNIYHIELVVLRYSSIKD